MAPLLKPRGPSGNVQQPKISHAGAAAIGAGFGLLAIIISMAVGNTQTDSANEPGYWGGVALMGGLIGVAVAAIKNRSRR